MAMTTSSTVRIFNGICVGGPLHDRGLTWDKDVKFLTASNHDGQQGEYHHNIISGKWIWHEEERLPKREPVTIEAIEAKAAELMALFEQVPAARYRALAITSLELAVIWIGKELKQ